MSEASFSLPPSTNFIILIQMNEANPTRMSSDHINRTTPTPSPTQQPLFALVVTVFLNLMQIKYHEQSPFESHPKTMIFFIAFLLMYYCFSSCDAPKPPGTTPDNNNTIAAGANSGKFSAVGMVICGSFSLASLLSVLLTGPLSPLAFSLASVFSLSQIIPSSYVRTIWESFKKASYVVMDITKKFIIMGRFRHPQPTQHAMRRRRGGGLLQVQLPWLPQDQVPNDFRINEVEMLPV